jgi:hypothetical protein
LWIAYLSRNHQTILNPIHQTIASIYMISNQKSRKQNLKKRGELISSTVSMNSYNMLSFLDLTSHCRGGLIVNKGWLSVLCKKTFFEEIFRFTIINGLRYTTQFIKIAKLDFNIFFKVEFKIPVRIRRTIEKCRKVDINKFPFFWFYTSHRRKTL